MRNLTTIIETTLKVTFLTIITISVIILITNIILEPTIFNVLK